MKREPKPAAPSVGNPSGERFRLIFEQAAVGVALLDRETLRFVKVNDKFCDFLGYPASELLGKSFREVTPSCELQADLVQAGRLRRGEIGSFTREKRYLHKNGSIIWGKLVVSPLHEEGAEPSLSIAIVEDITSCKEAERALQKSELQFRQMAETIQEVFWLTSAVTHALLYISPGFERVWGRTCEELYADSRIWMAAILPEDLPRVRRDLEKMGGGQAIDMEYRIMRPDGTLRWISDRGYPLRDDTGAVTIVTGVASDITERKLAQQAIKKYAHRLIVQEEDLRKRIAMELHDDIGQVLAALGLNLAHLGNHLQEGAGADIRAVLEDSRQLTKEISRSVRNLMVEMRPTQLDEYGLAAAIRSHADQYALRTGIKVFIRSDPRFPRLAARQEIALFRITQEALSNVSKHAAAARVTVSQRCEGGELLLSIADDGCGFLPGEASPQPTGSGWGLTIMRERAELIGASFRVDSAPGAGTTVTLAVREEL